MTITDELRLRREAVVREHMESENTQDFDATIGTFDHPHYELVPTGDVYDGEAVVREYYRISRASTPDQRNELIALHTSDESVIVEFWLRGTPANTPTGRGFECRMIAIFGFEGERIVTERVYWDRQTIAAQLRGK